MLVPYDHLRLKAHWYARRMRLAVIGGLLLAIGGGFLVAAGWKVLAEQFAPLVATLSCAAVFLGAGLIFLSRVNAQPEPRIPSLDERLRADAARGRYTAPDGQFPALMEAFLFGVATYTRVRNQRRR